MKKIYTIVLATIISSTVSAQMLTETFESFELSNSGFLIGTQPNDTLRGDYLNVINDYTPAWSSWMGFAISNIQNNTSGDYSNQYASITNGGDNSNQYAIMYSNGSIVLHNPSYLRSMRVTNTTYGALTMQNGDPFAKQFGSPLNAAGIEDGTNGADFFRLLLTFELMDGTQLSTIKEIYLADFRFEDDTQDYILTNWLTVEFPEIENEVIKAIHCSFESSDMGEWGMNNPAYFALDNVLLETANLSTAQLQTQQLRTFPNPTKDVVKISGIFESWNLMNLASKIIQSGQHTAIDLTDLPAGTYILELETKQGKKSERIHKL